MALYFYVCNEYFNLFFKGRSYPGIIISLLLLLFGDCLYSQAYSGGHNGAEPLMVPSRKIHFDPICHKPNFRKVNVIFFLFTFIIKLAVYAL